MSNNHQFTKIFVNPSYLCSWNNNDKVEIHTIETLKQDYPILFNEQKNEIFCCHVNGLDDYSFIDYIKLSSKGTGLKDTKNTIYVKPVDFLNVPFDCDNMTITRIK